MSTLVNFQEMFENISASLNFKFILDFLILIHWFLDLNFEIFQPFLVSISCLDLDIFEIFSDISQPGIYILKLWFFSLRSYLSWTLKIFWNFFKLSWLELDFENFKKNFKLVFIVIELWIFWTELNLCTHMIELVYNFCTVYHRLTQLYCTWLMFPLQKFRSLVKIILNIFYHAVAW